MNRLNTTAFLLACAWFAVTAWSGEVTLKEDTIDGKTAYRLENDRVSLLVSPGRGGAVTSYRDKLGGNVELILQQPRNGLCMDHFQAQPWPGELLDAVYEGQVVKKAADECVVQVAYTVKGRWEVSEYPKLEGLRLEKTYTLRADRPSLSCRIKIANPTKNARLIDYWLQNVFFAGGKFDADVDKSFRPSVRGVRVKSDQKPGMSGTEEWMADFSDGWMALLDTRAKSGLVILTDYHDLRYEYVCGASRTLEPMFEVAYLPAGATREYWTEIVPVAGVDNVLTATRDYVAGYRMQSDGKGSGNVEVAAVRSTRPVKQITMQLRVMNVAKRDQLAAVGPLMFAGLGDAPQTKSASFANAGPDPLVLQGEVKAEPTNGEPAEYRFEDYYNGTYQWGENIQTDMTSPYYVGVRPPQQLRITKPNPVKLARHWGRRAWYVEGVLDNFYDVTAAVRMTMGYDGTDQYESARRAFVTRNSFGDRLSAFPYDYEELLNYNYVILGGASKNAFGKIGLEMLSDFVEAGGAIVVLGGPMAYAPTQLGGTKFADFWPVKMAEGKCDLVDVGGAPIEIADPESLFLQGIDWSAKPCVRFLHNVEVKPGAKVVLTAGGKPFMVTGEAGPKKTRIICILGAPMGTLEKGKLPFWEWDEWKYLLRQIFWWCIPYYDTQNFVMP